MLKVLRNGESKMKNDRYVKIASCIRWRQKYDKCDKYSYEFDGGGKSISVKQINDGEVNGLGTGARVWAAAVVLAKYLEKMYSFESQFLRGRRVCELGSGTGFTGLVIAALGAEITLTDRESILFLIAENVAAVCRDNIDKFGDELVPISRVQLKTYDWGECFEHLKPPFDMIIVSDCILPKLYPIEPLVKALSELMDEKTVAYISYEHRCYPHFDPRLEFERIASLYGLQKALIPISAHHPVYSCEDIEIWEVRKIARTVNLDVSHYSN